MFSTFTMLFTIQIYIWSEKELFVYFILFHILFYSVLFYMDLLMDLILYSDLHPLSSINNNNNNN